jgi:ankyrin repeat protein
VILIVSLLYCNATFLTIIYEAIIEELCKNGAKVEEPNKAGDTPLMFATAKGNTKCVLKLIEMGANVNAANSHGLTALVLSAMNGRSSITKILLQHGAGWRISLVD